MHTVRSASAAGTLSRSASETASTVSMCNARQVRMMRAAISPRLAIRMRRIAKGSIRLDDAQEDFAVLHERPVGGQNFRNRTASLGTYRIHELHDLNDAHDRILLDHIARRHIRWFPRLRRSIKGTEHGREYVVYLWIRRSRGSRCSKVSRCRSGSRRIRWRGHAGG